MLTVMTLAGLVWLAVALLAAVVIGRSVHLADRRTAGTGAEPALTSAALVASR